MKRGLHVVEGQQLPEGMTRYGPCKARAWRSTMSISALVALLPSPVFQTDLPFLRPACMRTRWDLQAPVKRFGRK